MDIQKRMDELVTLLNEANYRYYVLDDPKMLDFEYDRLLRELEDLERENEILAYVDDTYTESEAKALGSKLEKVPNVASATFISREEAMKAFADSCGDSNYAKHKQFFKKIFGTKDK